MDIEQFRKAGYQAIDRICEYYYSLQERPVSSQVEPGYLRIALPDAPPEKGEDFQLIADDYQKHIVPGLTHWQHPSFFAYFPTSCTFESVIADLYANALPNPGFNWSCSPACTELEAIVMDWSARLFGLSGSFLNTTGVGGGVLQTTASDSCLVTVVAARARYMRLHPTAKLEELVVLTTTQTHSLGKKAALVLGLQCHPLPVRAEDQFSLRGEVLRQVLEHDSLSGLRPFIIIGTVGSTSSGAVDRLDEIGQVLQHHRDVWLHVDAAWAGVSFACPEYRQQGQLDAINTYADSFCTNFHKWGLVNFDCSALWVRDRTHLTDALDVTPEFLRTKHGDAGTVIDYRNWHLALGRRFRALKVWFVLRSYGTQGFQSHIHRTVAQNNVFAALVQASDNFALVTKPTLGLTVFRLLPALYTSRPLCEQNNLNREFYQHLSARSSELLLTQTDLNGVFCLRMAVGSTRTEEKHVRRAFEVLSEVAEVTLNKSQAPKH